MRKNKKVLGALLLMTILVCLVIAASRQHLKAQAAVASDSATAKHYVTGIYILTFEDKFENRKRAKASDSPAHVHKGQKLTFKGKGCTLEFKDQPAGEASPFTAKPGRGKTVEVTIVQQVGTYRYYATCDGIDVEGSSPPIIIVDP